MDTLELEHALPGVRFLPYIGKNYINSIFEKRILVLGESHYADSDESNEFTIEVVTAHSKGEGTIPFFTKIERMICGHLVQNDTVDFWNEIAFYNFVQVSLDSARQRPTWEEWKTGLDPFQKVLEYLVPDKLIICGKQMWNEILPPCAGEERLIDVGSVKAITGEYVNKSGHVISAFAMNHPSSYGFSVDAWTPLIQKFIHNS